MRRHRWPCPGCYRSPFLLPLAVALVALVLR